MENKTCLFNQRKAVTYFSKPLVKAKLFIVLDGDLISLKECDDNCIFCMVSSEKRLDDYTPYPHEAINPRFPPFGGEGESFLRFVIEELLPKLKEDFSIDEDNIIYGGISLGGLHSIFSSYHQTPFRHFFSICGSFWYPSFVETLKDKEFPKDIDVTMINGSKEGAKHAGLLLEKAPEKAKEVVALLKDKGIDVDFTLDDYGHHDHISERFKIIKDKILKKIN